MPRGRAPERYGIDEVMPQTYLGQLAHPFARTGGAQVVPERERAPVAT